MRHFIRDFQEVYQGLGKQGATKYTGVLNRIPTYKGFPSRTLYQKIEGNVEINRNQLRRVTGLLTGHCNLKRLPFKQKGMHDRLLMVAVQGPVSAYPLFILRSFIHSLIVFRLYSESVRFESCLGQRIVTYEGLA
jgi:hypothetical protein